MGNGPAVKSGFVKSLLSAGEISADPAEQSTLRREVSFSPTLHHNPAESFSSIVCYLLESAKAIFRLSARRRRSLRIFVPILFYGSKKQVHRK